MQDVAGSGKSVAIQIVALHKVSQEQEESEDLKKLFVTKPDDILHTCKLRACKFPKNSMDVNYMYRCHPYHFMKICNPPVNEPIGSYQIHHLKTRCQVLILNPRREVCFRDLDVSL